MGRGHGFLGLDYFQIVGDAGGKSVAGLDERLFRQIDGTARDLHLLVGGRDVQQSGADLVFNLAAQVFQLGAVLAQRGFRLQDVGMNLATLKNGNVQPAGDGEGSVRVPGLIPRSP